MSKNLILIGILGVLLIAIYLNYFYFIKDGIKKKSKKKKESIKLANILTKKINVVEMSDYKNLYDDYVSLDKEIKNFVQANGYMKNEIKLIKLIEEMKESNKKVDDLRHHDGTRDFKEDFSEKDITKIKELIRNIV